MKACKTSRNTDASTVDIDWRSCTRLTAPRSRSWRNARSVKMSPTRTLNLKGKYSWLKTVNSFLACDYSWRFLWNLPLINIIFPAWSLSSISFFCQRKHSAMSSTTPVVRTFTRFWWWSHFSKVTVYGWRLLIAKLDSIAMRHAIHCIWKKDFICQRSRLYCVSSLWIFPCMNLLNLHLIYSKSFLLLYHPYDDVLHQRRSQRKQEPHPGSLERLHARLHREVLLPSDHRLAR